MKTLKEIAIERKANKEFHHNYFERYERFFAPLRDKEITIFEIGVFHGNSLRIWKEYFPKAKVWGIDIMAECKQYEEERINIRIGSQIDNNFLLKTVKEMGTPDIIIDDGSHVKEHIKFSFEVLFPHLAAGGIYAMEDMHVDKSRPAETDYFDFLKEKIDDLQWNGLCRPQMMFGDKKVGWEDIIKNEHRDLTYTEHWIRSMTFYRHMCFIEKEEKDWMGK